MQLVPYSVTRPVFRTILVAKKNAPNAMFVGGIVGVVASTVLACRATLKLADELPDMKKELEEVKNYDAPEGEDPAKDVVYVYAKNVSRVARLYAPAAVVGVVSIGALTGSHVTLNKRNASLTAAYAGLSNAYSQYRDRVKEELGVEKEDDVYHAVTTVKTVDADGNKVKVKLPNPEQWSEYARFFDESSENFVKNVNYNRAHIRCQQEYANHLLNAKGFVLLNDVYVALGFERTKAGCVVGWVQNGDGDGYIDFGLEKAYNAGFTEGIEPRVLLDFNVDGIVYDLLKD